MQALKRLFPKNKSKGKLFIILLLKSLLLIGIVLLARQYLHENIGGFPYGEIPYERYKVTFLSAVWTNFDGLHYINIAHSGYAMYEQAFFPLFPILLKYIGVFFGGNHIYVGLALSFLSFYIGAIYLLALCEKIFDKKTSHRILLYVLLFPTAFYFQAVYTESLLFMFVAMALYYLHEKKYMYAAIFATLASFTRLQGVFLIFPFAVHFYNTRQTITENIATLVKKHIIVILSPTFGLLAYMAYLWMKHGDPLMFFHVQPAFGANRSTSLVLLPQVYWRYFKIFFTARFTFQYFVACIEFFMMTTTLLFTSYAIWKSYIQKRRFELGIGLFSVFYILLPTLTGTFSSVPRYSLLALSQYFIFAHLPVKIQKYVIVPICIILQIVLLSMFSRGYFVS